MRLGLDLGQIKLKLAACMLPLMLSGCASLAGSPERVVSLADSMSLVSGPNAPYRMEQALKAFDDQDATATGPRHGLTRQQYRNMVVTLFLNAADAQYSAWRSRVSDERRELGLGFDSTVIGLTGIASVARQSLVRSLTATASIMAGTRGTIDRNVYFDRTLPGLLASMDAGRLRIRAEITRRLSSDSDAEYPLATAFADISNYELAASLDRAIEQVTAQAAQERAAAQREYDTAIHACHVTEDVSTHRYTINHWARSQTVEKLSAFATRIGADQSPIPNGTDASEGWRNRIRARLLERYCTNAELAVLIASEQIK
jgi:hypothetical protein